MAQEAHEVIFHQDGLSEGQWKVLEVDLILLPHFCFLSSEGAGETGVEEQGRIKSYCSSGLPPPPFSLLALFCSVINTLHLSALTSALPVLPSFFFFFF